MGSRTLAIVRGDITRIPADAIVNAANESLAGGGGVDGAIHRAGGPAIMADLEARYGPLGVRGCPTGSAVLTVAGDLPARWVVHAVGPIWRGGRSGEEDALRSAYRSSLQIADEVGARSVTFPAVSCGIYDYPLDEGARVGLEMVRAHLAGITGIERATFVLYSESTERAFADTLDVIRATPPLSARTGTSVPP